MVRVGLTGGIASGKTAVSDRLRERGAVVIDADLLAREVVEPGTPALAAVIDRFGPTVLKDSGLKDSGLDRAALAAIVFADEGARRDLERIIHPAVRARAAEIEAGAAPDAVVVHVIPLLVETRQAEDFDVVVVVDVDHDTQLARLRSRSSMSSEEAEGRLAAQATREQRLAVADWVLDNSGPVLQLDQKVNDLWASVSRTAAGG